MKINESLRFFRKNNNQIQKEVLPTINNPKQSPSTLSRFENGTEKISIREFLEILDNLSISPEEILKFSDSDQQTEQLQYENIYITCAKDPNSIKKKTLLKYYDYLNTKKHLNTREFSNLLSIKFHFSIVWKDDIEAISTKEINKAHQYLLNRRYYTKYDYSLLLKICTLLPTKKVNKLIRLMIPIQDVEKRTTETKAYAYNALRNIITQRLHEKDIYNATKYITIAKKEFSNSDDYRFKIHIIFLEYLTEYITNTEKLEYYSKIITLMSTLQEIGEISEVNIMKSDLNKFLTSNPNLSQSIEQSLTI